MAFESGSASVREREASVKSLRARMGELTQALSAAQLKVPNGSLFIGNPHADPDDAFVADVPAGTYVVDARFRDLAREWWV